MNSLFKSGFLLVLMSLSLLAAEPVMTRNWAPYMPAVFKHPEPVDLVRNPLRAVDMSEGGKPRASVKGLASMRVAELLSQGLHGFVSAGEHPCILFGSRIVGLGQEIELFLDEPGGRKVLRLRLRSISPTGLCFLADENSARVLGAEEWSCPLPKGRR